LPPVPKYLVVDLLWSLVWILLRSISSEKLLLYAKRIGANSFGQTQPSSKVEICPMRVSSWAEPNTGYTRATWKLLWQKQKMACFPHPFIRKRGAKLSRSFDVAIGAVVFSMMVSYMCYKRLMSSTDRRPLRIEWFPRAESCFESRRS
jgi:hypothetical protein